MKKTFSIIGIIFGLLMIVFGILAVSDALGGFTVAANYPYDSGYATFGADFYSYVSNNAALAARNVRELGNLVKNVSSVLLIGLGLFMVCLFGTKLAECKETAAVPSPAAAKAADAPAFPETVSADEQISVDDLPDI